MSDAQSHVDDSPARPIATQPHCQASPWPVQTELGVIAYALVDDCGRIIDGSERPSEGGSQ